MPEVTLKFQLPEEQSDLTHALDGPKYNSVIFDLGQEFYRRNIKYGIQENLRLRVLKELADTESLPLPITTEVLDAIITAVLEICRTEMNMALTEEGITDV